MSTSDNIVTLAAVTLGGFVGYGGSWLTELRAKRERERTRWDEARLRAYFEYAAAIKKEIRTYDRIATGLGYRRGARPIDFDRGMERSEVEQDVRTTLLEQVRLIGSQATVTAAQQLQDAAWAIHEVLDKREGDVKQNYLTAFSAAAKARALFNEIARKELKITDGDGTVPHAMK